MNGKVILLTLLALGSFVAKAQAEPSVEERAVAADLFEQATEAQRRAAWSECITALSDAVLLVETPGLRFHLAYCKEQQQRWVEALVDYKRAQEMVDQGFVANDVSELLPEAIGRLELELPRLTLSLSEVPTDATLFVDGSRRSVTLFGKAMPLDPGSRRIEVLSPGHEPFRSEVTLLPRERRALEVVLVPHESEPPKIAPVEAEAESEPFLGPRGWVLLSEGLVAASTLGLGLYFSAEAEARDDDRRLIASRIGDTMACYGDNPDRRCALLDSAIQKSDDARVYATAAYITSGAAATALIATWLFWPSAEETAFHAELDSEGALVSVRGRF